MIIVYSLSLEVKNTAERMKGSPLSVQLAMLPDECVRSDLALDAAQRM